MACLQTKKRNESCAFLCPFSAVSVLLRFGESVLAQAADRALEVIGNVLPFGAGGNAVLRVAGRFVVHIAAGALVLVHVISSSFFISLCEKRAFHPFSFTFIIARCRVLCQGKFPRQIKALKRRDAIRDESGRQLHARARLFKSYEAAPKSYRRVRI